MWPRTRIIRLLQRPKRTGTTTVEFALVLPVFLMLLAMAFEFARLNIIHHTADNAAYEAARFVMVPGGTADEAVAKAEHILGIVSTQGATVTITPPVLTVDTLVVDVEIDIPMDQNGWFLPRFSTTKTLHAHSRMKTERAQQ